MKSAKEYSDYLDNIVEYAGKAESFLEGVSLDDFHTHNSCFGR